MGRGQAMNLDDVPEHLLVQLAGGLPLPATHQVSELSLGHPPQIVADVQHWHRVHESREATPGERVYGEQPPAPVAKPIPTELDQAATALYEAVSREGLELGNLLAALRLPLRESIEDRVASWHEFNRRWADFADRLVQLRELVEVADVHRTPHVCQIQAGLVPRLPPVSAIAETPWTFDAAVDVTPVPSARYMPPLMATNTR